MKIASVLLVRDAKPWRINQAVESRHQQTRKPDENMLNIQEKGPIHFARLCNQAIKETECEFICFSGVDEILSPNAFEVVEKHFEKNPKSILMCARIDLDEESNNPKIDFVKDFKKWAKKKSDHAAPGSFQCLPVKWLKKVGGFDERYVGWGYYDCEIVKRAAMDGLEEVWLHDSDPSMTICHIWHPERKGRTSEFVTKNEKLFREKIELVVNKGKKWGQKWK